MGINPEIVRKCIDTANAIPAGGHANIGLPSGGHEPSTLRAKAIKRSPTEQNIR